MTLSLLTLKQKHAHTSLHCRQFCMQLQKLQEGWLLPTERASVSAISLRYILASPGHTPGTIAVNITWMERGFNACQTHSSVYSSIFNHLRVIARYWSEIATSAYWMNCFGPSTDNCRDNPLAFDALVGGVRIGIPEKRMVLRKLESWCY